MSSPDNMPSTYETQQQQTSSTRTTNIDRAYLTSRDGILQIAEMVLSVILFICGAAALYSHMTMLVFTGIFTLIFVLIMFLLRLFTLYEKIPIAIPWTLIEFVMYGVFIFFYAISGILAAVCAGFLAACGAGAFFSFVGVVLFAVDCFFHFQRWRSGALPAPSVTTTTTTTTMETQATY